MKTLLWMIPAGCLSLGAVELDLPAVGRDLNGWGPDHLARYGIGGLTFHASKPVRETAETGAHEFTLRLEQVERRSTVYVAEVRVVASPEGRARSIQVEGMVDGAPFVTAAITRPDPPEAAEGSERAEPDPEARMRAELSEALERAIDRARERRDGIRRDVAARLFGARAGETSTLVEGTDQVVKTLIRRLRP